MFHSALYSNTETVESAIFVGKEPMTQILMITNSKDIRNSRKLLFLSGIWPKELAFDSFLPSDIEHVTHESVSEHIQTTQERKGSTKMSSSSKKGVEKSQSKQPITTAMREIPSETHILDTLLNIPLVQKTTQKPTSIPDVTKSETKCNQNGLWKILQTKSQCSIGRHSEYKILSAIGSGSHGNVYKAAQYQISSEMQSGLYKFRTYVALKEFTEYDEFKLEIAVLRKLSSTNNTVHILGHSGRKELSLGFQATPLTYIIVITFIPGKDLESVMKLHNKYEQRMALEILNKYLV